MFPSDKCQGPRPKGLNPNIHFSFKKDKLRVHFTAFFLATDMGVGVTVAPSDVAPALPLSCQKLLIILVVREVVKFYSLIMHPCLLKLVYGSRFV